MLGWTAGSSDISWTRDWKKNAAVIRHTPTCVYGVTMALFQGSRTVELPIAYSRELYVARLAREREGGREGGREDELVRIKKQLLTYLGGGPASCLQALPMLCHNC